jgi:uncharacterized OB-fold protein
MTTEENAGALTHVEWKRALRDGVLLGQTCKDCGHQTAAPKAACAYCGSRSLRRTELPTKGVVHTETTVAVAPRQFGEQAPYQVAIIEVGDARVMAQTDRTVEIGDDVELEGIVSEGDDVAPLFG